MVLLSPTAGWDSLGGGKEVRDRDTCKSSVNRGRLQNCPAISLQVVLLVYLESHGEGEKALSPHLALRRKVVLKMEIPQDTLQKIFRDFLRVQVMQGGGEAPCTRVHTGWELFTISLLPGVWI